MYYFNDFVDINVFSPDSKYDVKIMINNIGPCFFWGGGAG